MQECRKPGCQASPLWEGEYRNPQEKYQISEPYNIPSQCFVLSPAREVDTPHLKLYPFFILYFVLQIFIPITIA